MFQKLLDRIARWCGYYTFGDVEVFVREAMKSKTDDVPPGSNDTSSDSKHLAIQSVPPGYIPYFVAYSHSSGFGCIEICVSQTIQTFGDVLSITDTINESLRTRYAVEKDPGVVILNWRQFDAPNPDGAKEPLPTDAPQSVVLRLVA